MFTEQIETLLEGAVEDHIAQCHFDGSCMQITVAMSSVILQLAVPCNVQIIIVVVGNTST